MWGSKGRSGYGDSTIQGDYDSWDGISPNGRQWKNEATMETRDLSGADYWHLRKQNRPTEVIPANLHMLNPNKANLAAYGDAVQTSTKRTTSIPLIDRILPQLKRVNLLTDQLVELEAEYKSGKMSIQEYTVLRDILSVKRSRAEVLYKKAINVKPVNVEDDEQGEDTVYKSNETPTSCGKNGVKNDKERSDLPVWLSSLSSSNCLKNPIINACKVWNKTVQLSQAARNYIQTLKDL